jgi:hypothetical protein
VLGGYRFADRGTSVAIKVGRGRVQGAKNLVKWAARPRANRHDQKDRVVNPSAAPPQAKAKPVHRPGARLSRDWVHCNGAQLRISQTKKQQSLGAAD